MDEGGDGKGRGTGTGAVAYASGGVFGGDEQFI